MSIRVLTAAVTVVTLAVPSLSVAQAPAGSDDGWTVPRAADGRPDLQGVWDYRTITPLERPESLAGRDFLTPEEVADLEARALERNTDEARPADAARDVSGAYNDFWWDRGQKVVPTGRTSLIVDPPDGRIPHLERARSTRRTPRGYDGPESRNLWERCLTRALPRLSGAYNNNFQIVQSAGVVAIINEMIHEVRLIPIDGGPHADRNIRQWAGDSRGHWEGDTLVVDTTNFSDRTSFRGSGENLGSIRVSQRHFGAFRGFAWVIRWESPCGSSWKTRSVFQGAVGAFGASTVPSASTGPVRVRQDDSQGGGGPPRPRTAVDR